VTGTSARSAVILDVLRDQVIERPEVNMRDALLASIHAIIAGMKRSAE
jgi:hypothetical protein